MWTNEEKHVGQSQEIISSYPRRYKSLASTCRPCDTQWIKKPGNNNKNIQFSQHYPIILQLLPNKQYPINPDFLPGFRCIISINQAELQASNRAMTERFWISILVVPLTCPGIRGMCEKCGPTHCRNRKQAFQNVTTVYGKVNFQKNRFATSWLMDIAWSMINDIAHAPLLLQSPPCSNAAKWLADRARQETIC